MNALEIIKHRLIGSSAGRLRDIARGIVPIIDSVLNENDELHTRCSELEMKNSQLLALCQQTERYRKEEKDRADKATEDLAMARSQMKPLIDAVGCFAMSTDGARELAERFQPAQVEHQPENQEAA